MDRSNHAANSMVNRGMSTRWAWSLPLTYVLHIAEELWGGISFYQWASNLWHVQFTRREFLVLNGIALTAMCVGTVLANRVNSMRWLTAAFGSAVTLNAALHIVGSLLTRSYSPGLVSGSVVWLPLGLFTLHRSRQSLKPGAFRRAMAVGVMMHALVTAIVLIR